MSRTLDLLQDLVSIPAPPGQEEELAGFLQGKVEDLGFKPSIDAKGNVLVRGSDSSQSPRIIVTAHLDEVALMVTGLLSDGRLEVTNLGGVYPWKWGEGPVEILAKEPIPGVLSFGSVHTDSIASPIVQGRIKPFEWTQATVFTGQKSKALDAAGVRPGTRIVISRARRKLTHLGDFVSGYFLDDRADLAAWLLILEKFEGEDVLFAATTSEEVGGEGAQYLLHQFQPEICIALELGPIVPDSGVVLSHIPSCWVKDSFAAAMAKDLEIISGLDLPVQFQYLSSGGSDASCAASRGLCARPVTFGIPMENTHGYEIIHRDGIEHMADLTISYLEAVRK
jgi:putative aminopeptidase FrvX